MTPAPVRVRARAADARAVGARRCGARGAGIFAVRVAPFALWQFARAILPIGRAGNLTRHVRTVHEKRRDHACPHCIAVFGHGSTLTEHVRAQHPNSDSSQQLGVL